jgi:hypothetical protein
VQHRRVRVIREMLGRPQIELFRPDRHGERLDLSELESLDVVQFLWLCTSLHNS